MTVISLFFSVLPQALAESSEFKKQETGLYKDVFDEGVYHEFTSYLHLERFVHKLTGGVSRAKNVNVFDEVPDSAFFINRHGRSRLSLKELEDGPKETEGPDLSKPLVVTSGKFEGLHPGFFVEDSRGDHYLLKFDPVDAFELRTTAEIVGCRFYHAIGYNVPQNTIIYFESSQIVPGPGAKIVDDTGFKKDLTAERLEEYLLFLPQDAQGRYRASASKILSGKSRGTFSFEGRRREDPNDPMDHKDLREIRALRVFSSWVNNYDVRQSNTLDIELEENGRTVLKHYVIDFNASLGGGQAYPMFTHEHMLDYGEAAKAFSGLGFWEKPWQKRWREAGSQINNSPAVGDFDNQRFDPGAFKLQLPYYAFKDLTSADAFWAAKIIMSFTDEEIQAMVKAGQLTDAADEAYIAKILVERRDIIGRYWFERANPLDAFDMKEQTLVFEDLAVKYHFAAAESTSYRIQVFGLNGGKKGRKIEKVETQEPSLDLSPWLENYDALRLAIRTVRTDSGKPSPYVFVEVSRDGIQEIIHED